MYVDVCVDVVCVGCVYIVDCVQTRRTNHI